MTEHSWSDLYDKATRAFCNTPRPQDEQAILDVFMTNPTLVARQVDEIGKAVHDGKVTYGWSALASRLAKGQTSDIRVDDRSERDKLIRGVERWIGNAGYHFDREEEIEAELFGDVGRLREWGQYVPATPTTPAVFTGDQVLRERLLGQWREVKARGVKASADAVERGQQAKATRAAVRQAVRRGTEVTA